MKRLEYCQSLESWDETLPLMPVYYSKKTGYYDISLANVCKREKKLTLDLESKTGFEEIDVKYADVNPEYEHLTGILPKEKRTLKGFSQSLLDAVEEYLLKLWNPTKFHLITHSAGRDSRIISYVLAKLRDKMDMGDFHFRCHGWEGEIFKQVMEEQGWHPSQYSVYKDGRLEEPDYFVQKFSQNINGFNRPNIEFWDDILSDADRQNTVLVSGQNGGEIFSYPIRDGKAFTENRYEDYQYNNLSVFYATTLIHNNWADALMPFASYKYLDIAFRMDKKHFWWVNGEFNNDAVRNEMLDLLGNKLPFVTGHKYNLKISKETANQMKKDYRASKFYKDFPIDIVRNATPWVVYENNDIEAIGRASKIYEDDFGLKLWGLATMYEHTK